ncbi:MAG: DUF1583 domain-containing protein [Planctomycetes bacterium]|nr:DUF1583 domain-containing protein [Planctomycetota bacterium]
MKWQEYMTNGRWTYSCHFIFLPSLQLLMLFFLLLGPAFIDTKALAQDTQPVIVKALPANQTDVALLARIRELASKTLSHLRGDRLPQALISLGEATDLAVSLSTEGDTGLGPAAAGLHRKLDQLDAEERFDLLYEWAMPTESRRTVRVLTSLIPQDAPPSVFARALGERPRRDSFAVPEIGDISGLFCTAWELVKAADDARSLRQLTSELTQLAENDVPNARFVLQLANIVAARRSDQQLLDQLTAYVAAFENRSDNVDLVIAVACLTKEWLQPIGQRIVEEKLEQTYDHESRVMRPFLRQALATAIGKRYQDASLEDGDGSDLELWVPSSVRETGNQARGTVRSAWLTHEDHTMHLAGPHSDYLFFKYPLVGEFEFSCDTQIGGRGGTNGGVGYGGLGYELLGAKQTLRVWDTYHGLIAGLPCPFVANRPQATFNNFVLKSTAGAVTLFCNRHATWIDSETDGANPWIFLRSYGSSASIFRHVKLTGAPMIPREVKMSGGKSLRSWVASFYDEQMLTDVPGEENDEGPSWFLKDGVIYGAGQKTEEAVARQNRLYYLRPLFDGESISYEFQYEPGKLEVHPALGRTAFLIEPGGVRLHWMTDGDHEWTGLAADNGVVEPLNRRGPKPLPLKSAEWNRVTLSLASDTLTLRLNDATIYTRKMELENDRTFGFYHDMNRSEARVRHVVMRGDWPERLTERELAHLTTASNPDRSDADRRLRGAIFDDRHVHGSVLAVHRHAAKLPPQERYAFLFKWVLPSPDHNTLRLASDFTPANPAPLMSDEDLDVPSRVASGGKLISPALDLVAVAKELGQLDELRGKVAIIATADEHQLRSQLAVLAMVEIELGDLAKARTTLDKFASSAADRTTFAFTERWAEALVIWQASQYSEARDAIRDLAFGILNKQRRQDSSSGHEAWDQHLPALMGRIRYFDLLESEPALRETATNRTRGQSPLANWVPASRETNRTRGQGFPPAQWAISAPATVENFASHHDDYLFYRIPLRGNFEIECDITGFGYRESSLWVAGRWARLFYTLSDVKTGDFRDEQLLTLDPPMHKTNSWIRYRAVVRDGVCTTYANGREIQRRVLDAEHDPWVAIRSWYKTNGAVRNLRITGNPEIPAEVRLTANAELPGWLPINDDHQVGPGGNWQQLGDLANGGGIHGTRSGKVSESHWEKLLRYHRPMVEDGTIEYEFFYRAGETHVHPALDRLAFMLQPDGVRMHWVTDGPFDRSELAPDNLFDELDNRRGPKAIPLKQNNWNRLQLSLAGDTVSLRLNTELIYERKLEPTNQRTFGLFHYADRTEAQVRRVVWRGEWPRELPAIAGDPA